MPLSLTLVWAVRPQDGERFSMSRFREIMDGLSVSLEGSLGSAVIGTGSITSDKLADTLITGLTDATAWGVPCVRSAFKASPLLRTFQRTINIALRSRRCSVGGASEHNHRCHIVAKRWGTVSVRCSATG